MIFCLHGSDFGDGADFRGPDVIRWIASGLRKISPSADIGAGETDYRPNATCALALSVYTCSRSNFGPATVGPQSRHPIEIRLSTRPGHT